jgi:hypothetical protein
MVEGKGMSAVYSDYIYKSKLDKSEQWAEFTLWFAAPTTELPVKESIYLTDPNFKDYLDVDLAKAKKLFPLPPATQVCLIVTPYLKIVIGRSFPIQGTIFCQASQVWLAVGLSLSQMVMMMNLEGCSTGNPFVYSFVTRYVNPQ